MTDSVRDIPELILRQCAAAAPSPWFPSAYARDTGIARDQLDAPLDNLRMGGLVRIADWVQGQGQGYALTPEGEQVLQNPRVLAQLRAGKYEPTAKAQAVTAAPTRLRSSAWERGEIVRDAVLYPPRPVVTTLLILANLSVFMVGVTLAIQNQVPVNDFLYGANKQNVFEILEKTGALKGEYIIQRKWERLLSCCFVHFGLLHLAVNMYSLYVLGRIQEGMWGRLRFLAIYLVAGLGGSCAMVISNPKVLGAGASGAIFGLMGSMGAWVFLNRRYLGRVASAWLRQLGIILVLNIFISSLPGISAAAHFGGGVVGLVAAVLLNTERFGRGAVRLLALLGFLALPVVSVAAILKAQSSGSTWKELGIVARRTNWEENVRPRVVGLWQDANQVQKDEVDPLLSRKATIANAEASEKLSDSLQNLQQKLGETLVLLKNAGPIDDVEAERERRLYLEQVAARMVLVEQFRQEFIKLIELGERRARLKLTWQEKDEQEFIRQKQLVQDLSERVKASRPG